MLNIDSYLSRQLKNGIEILIQTEIHEVWVCFIKGELDYDLIPTILPEERFISGYVHVSQLSSQTDINDEISTLLNAVDNEDTIILFCEDTEQQQEGLAYFNFTN